MPLNNGDILFFIFLFYGSIINASVIKIIFYSKSKIYWIVRQKKWYTFLWW